MYKICNTEIPEYDSNVYTSIIKEILFKISRHTRNDEVYDTYTVILYNFIDTKQLHKIRNNSKDIDKAVSNNLNYLLNENSAAGGVFNTYIKNTFIADRRFVSIKRNKEYVKKIFRLYLTVINIFNKLYLYTLEKRYAPGGSGYLEAFNDFNKNLS